MYALLRPLFLLSLLLLLVPCLEAAAERPASIGGNAVRQSVVNEYKYAYARPSKSVLRKLFGKHKTANRSRRPRVAVSW